MCRYSQGRPSAQCGLTITVNDHLSGEVSEEAPPASLGDSRHWHEYTRACQRTPRAAYTESGTSGPPCGSHQTSSCSRTASTCLSRALDMFRICARTRLADYPGRKTEKEPALESQTEPRLKTEHPLLISP